MSGSRRVIDGGPLPTALPLADILIVTDGGPWAQHNHPCPVCGTWHAILQLGDGVFGPCGHCTAAGWQLTRRRKWWQR